MTHSGSGMLLLLYAVFCIFCIWLTMGSMAACLPGLAPQRILGAMSRCLVPEAVSVLHGTGFQFQLNSKFTICPNSHMDEVFVWEANDFGSPLYWIILNSYLSPFISSSFCITSAVNYSLRIPLTYFFLLIATVSFRRRSSSNWKIRSDKFSFPSSTFSDPIT